MTQEFAIKLRLTAALLGCGTHKDLCARFRAVNPSTSFDLARSEKWLQGRAMPRSPQVYEDWARLLRTKRPADWLVGCSIDAFLAEVCARFEADPQELRRQAGLSGTAAGDGALAGTGGARHYLCGGYACYSHAWSPYYRGSLIRGHLRIAPARGSRLAVTYSEAIAGGTARLQGFVSLLGRTIHLDIRDESSQAPLFLSLFLPTPPASVLTGLMSGATLVGPVPEPSVSRYAAVRVPDAAMARLDASNRYMEAAASTIADDLRQLGLTFQGLEAGAGALLQFLAGGHSAGFDQTPAATQAQLVELFDRAYLADPRHEEERSPSPIPLRRSAAPRSG
jgi:hypothetical protein